MKAYFLNWQDPENRHWYPVGKLIDAKEFFVFSYTKGALKSKNFVPFGNMSDVNSIYLSKELFPIFANRVMSAKRPEFNRYAIWSGLDPQRRVDPLLLMARMGGGRATDTLQVYPVPERSANKKYHTVFFIHGLSHLSEFSQIRTLSFQPGDQIFPMLDVQNPYDKSAIALRSIDPATLIGYCPRYISQDLLSLASVDEASLKITVKRVNIDAPAQFRVLCEAVSNWPTWFEPCEDEEHNTIVDFNPRVILEKAKERLGL